MPNMSGGLLAKELLQLRPDTKLLFVSGYAGKTVLDHKVLDLETNFLQKPYSLKQLAAKIRYALTHGPGSAAESARPLGIAGSRYNDWLGLDWLHALRRQVRAVPVFLSRTAEARYSRPFCFSSSAASLVYSLLQIVAAARYLAVRPPGLLRTEPISVLKPLAGLDLDLESNLRTFFRTGLSSV